MNEIKGGQAVLLAHQDVGLYYLTESFFLCESPISHHRFSRWLRHHCLVYQMFLFFFSPSCGLISKANCLRVQCTFDVTHLSILNYYIWNQEQKQNIKQNEKNNLNVCRQSWDYGKNKYYLWQDFTFLDLPLDFKATEQQVCYHCWRGYSIDFYGA